MKIDYNLTLIMYLKLLKNQGLIKTWSDGARIYFEIEKQEITPTTLGAQANKIAIGSINTQLLFDYCKLTDKLTKKVEVKDFDEPKEEDADFKLTTDTIVRTISIPKEDYIPVFDIDIEKDSKELIRKKIMNKISDDVFLLTYLGFNPGLYEVTKITSGAWTTPVKVENSAGEKSVEVILNEKFSVSIAKRKKEILYYTKEECDEWLDNFLKTRRITPFDMFEEKQKSRKKVNENIVDEDLIMVCPGLELHLGKLGSVVDFEDYSTKQAMWRIKKTTLEIMEYQKKHKASSLILGVGNDYYNSDTVDDKTTAGTPQYNDSRFKEVYLWGKIGYLRMIETLKQQFDKIVIKGNPGNHDEKSSFSLFTNIYDIYNLTQDPKIDVSFTYKDLRYTTCYEYGKNLIVFSHGKSPEGKNLKDKDLAESIKYQFPEEYNRAQNVYVFAGHIHQDSENKFDKVTVIRTASLTGIENWHYSNLYLGQRQGHSVYLIDKNKGYVGKNNITIIEDEKKNKIRSVDRRENTDIAVEMTKALDLTEESAKNELAKKELYQIRRKIRAIDKKHNSTIKAIGDVLDIDLSNYDEHDIKKIMNILGYDKEIEPLENQKQLILKYREK
ncbi:MAG: hypothetical protein WDA12_04515 [Bacilli bacterium]